LLNAFKHKDMEKNDNMAAAKALRHFIRPIDKDSNEKIGHIVRNFNILIQKPALPIEKMILTAESDNPALPRRIALRFP